MEQVSVQEQPVLWAKSDQEKQKARKYRFDKISED